MAIKKIEIRGAVFKQSGFSFFQLSWVPNVYQYLKSIETHARAFLTLIILSIGTVCTVHFNFLDEFISVLKSLFDYKKYSRLSLGLFTSY